MLLSSVTGWLDSPIFSLTKNKIKILVEGLRHYDEIKLGYTHLTKLMQADFEQPKFYTLLFKRWDAIK